MTSTRWTGRRVAKARAYMATTLPTTCTRCGNTITPDDTWHVDHIPARRFLPPDEWDNPDHWGVAHAKCNTRAGGQIGAKITNTRRAAARTKTSPKGADTPAPPSLGRPAESQPRPLTYTPLGHAGTMPKPHAIPSWWPHDLRTPPENASWPRVATEPHPLASGTYGPLVVAHAASYGLTLRWWQEYVMARLLEHDADGRLLWAEAAVSVARQTGKGHGVIRPLCEWRSEVTSELFGEPQTVLHVAHQVNTVMEIATPAVARARDRGDRVRLTNGEQQILRPDGSRWLMRSTTGAYGFSVNLAVVDEVWAVSPRVIDSMIVPTMTERVQPQLVMLSTANASPQPTYVRFRDAAGVGSDRLVLEWSPPDEARSDPFDRRWWRMGAPHWSGQRERMMLRQVEKAGAADFGANWLNVWPREVVQARERAMPGFEVLPLAGPLPPRGGVVAIDEARDGSRFARVVLVGDSFWYDESPAVEALVPRANMADHVIVGLSIEQVALKAGLRHKPHKYGAKETGISTPMLMLRVREGRLAHNHNQAALSQAAGMVVREEEAGKKLSAKDSADDILVGKLLGWCLLLSRGVSRSRPLIYA